MRGRLILFALLAAAPLLAAQPELPTVTEIRFRNLGPGRPDETYVLAQIGIRPGQPLDRVRINRDVRALLDTGLFSHVEVTAEPTEGGYALIVGVRSRYRLAGRVRVEGADHFRDARIRDWLDLHEGDLIDEQIVGERARRIREEYEKDYYPHVNVSWALDETDRERALARLTVRVEEGPRARVQRFVFEGNRRVSSKTLRSVLRQPAFWNPFWLFRKRRYSAEELDAARVSVRDAYRERGFLNVDVGAPRVERLPDDEDLAIHIPIEEGEQFRFGETTLSGVTLFPEAALLRLASLPQGEPASTAVLRDRMQALRDYYTSRGYLETRVLHRFLRDEDEPVVNVAFEVREGRLVSIRNIRIQGNTRTKDKVIRRELLVSPGDEFNEVKVRTSRNRVKNLGFFSEVRTYPEDTADPAEKNLVIDVDERRTGQFMVGAGFSSIDQLTGFVELSQGNFDLTGWPWFTGGGQKLKLRAQLSQTSRRYELSFVEPWFLDRKLALGFDLYRTEYDYSDYDLTRSGGAVSLTKPLPGANRIRFTYQLEESVLSDVADTNLYFFLVPPTGEPYSFTNQTDEIKSSFEVSLQHDTRDNPFVPTRGTRATAFAELAGGVFNFDTEVYRVGFRVKQYVPLWFGHVLSGYLRGEVVDSYGETEDVPISSRLFIGGGRTLRGFDYRDVGPKVVRTTESGSTIYRPVGGESLAMASLEYSVPLVKDVMRIASFYDVGNVWYDAYDFDLDVLASSWGLGIRFDLPGFPIRVDRAWVIEKDNDITDEDAWVIWIGYDY